MVKNKKDLCKLLGEVEQALYYVYDVSPAGVDSAKYEGLYSKVADFAAKIECKRRK